MEDFITALGLAIALEGIAYALFPEGMKAMMAQMQTQSPTILRIAGLVAAITGVLVIWLIRG